MKKNIVDHKLSGALAIAFILMICLAIYGCALNDIEVDNLPTKPVINYFVSDRQSIKHGESVNLNWNVNNADKVFIQPGIKNIASNGSIKVSPESDTEYILSASNSYGETNVSLKVEVEPIETKETNCFSVGCDPVSGRNPDISFSWEQLSLCTEYTLQIAKDPNFTLLVFNRNEYAPSTSTSPGLIYFSGGILECGHTYYVRVRCTATITGQHILSPWSILGCITVNAGFPISD